MLVTKETLICICCQIPRKIEFANTQICMHKMGMLINIRNYFYKPSVQGGPREGNFRLECELSIYYLFTYLHASFFQLLRRTFLLYLRAHLIYQSMKKENQH